MEGKQSNDIRKALLNKGVVGGGWGVCIKKAARISGRTAAFHLRLRCEP